MGDKIEHTLAAEILIVLSQTIFFVFLFLILKYGIIDRQGWMDDREKVKNNIIPLGAIFFAILTLIGVIMIPLQSYEYGHIVLICTIICIFFLCTYEIKRIYYGTIDADDKTKGTPIQSVSRDIYTRNTTAVNKKKDPIVVKSSGGGTPKKVSFSDFDFQHNV